jgi:5-methylcytosine-specific restriction endonuclease McrA
VGQLSTPEQAINGHNVGVVECVACRARFDISGPVPLSRSALACQERFRRAIGPEQRDIEIRACNHLITFNGYQFSDFKRFLCADCKEEYRAGEAHQRQLADLRMQAAAEARVAQARLDMQNANLSPWKRLEAIYDCFTEEEADRLRALPYRLFLQTTYWKIVRAHSINRAGSACRLCNRKSPLEVHHRTYAHHGLEHQWYAEDLIVLCNPCHAKFHDKLPAPPR